MGVASAQESDPTYTSGKTESLEGGLLYRVEVPPSRDYNNCFVYGAFTSDPRGAKAAGRFTGPLGHGQLLSGNQGVQQTRTYVIDSREDADFSLALHGSSQRREPCAVTDLLPQLRPLSATVDSLGRVNAPAERQLRQVGNLDSFVNPRILVDGIRHLDRFYLRDLSRRSSLQGEAGSNPGAMADEAALETLIHRAFGGGGSNYELASSLFSADADQDVGLVEETPSFAMSAAFDAHANLAVIYDELYRLGLNSYDGEGGSVLAVVHRPLGGIIAGRPPNASSIDNILFFERAGSRTPNLCGTGFQNNESWQFQNSYASILDVVAHEFGHAVTEAHSSLVYAAESGALNEGFSDWLGVALDVLAKNDTNWEIGDGRLAATSRLFCRLPALRSIEDPGRYNDPDLYRGENWGPLENCRPGPENDNCHVHTNSGVPNHAFYRMVAGLPQSGSDRRGLEPFAGMAMSRAISIGLYANRFLWSSDESLASGADDMVLAAYILYGREGGQEIIATERAWGYVGLPPALGYEALSTPAEGFGLELSATASVEISGMAVSEVEAGADAAAGLLASLQLCWQLEPPDTGGDGGSQGPGLGWTLAAPDGTQVARDPAALPADCFSTVVDSGFRAGGSWSLSVTGPVGSTLSWTLSLNFEPPLPDLRIDALDVIHPSLPFLRVDDPAELVARVVNRRRTVWDPAGLEDSGFYVSFTVDGLPACQSEIHTRRIAVDRDRPALRCAYRELTAGPRRVQAEIVRQPRAPFEGQSDPADEVVARTFNWQNRLRPDLALATDTLIAWSHRVIGETTAVAVGLTNVGEAPWEQTGLAPGRFRLAFFIEGEALCHSVWNEEALAVGQSRSFFCAASWSPTAAVSMPQDYRVRAQIQWEPDVFAMREGPPSAPRQGNNSVSKVFRWLAESPLPPGGAAPFIVPPAAVRLVVPDRNVSFPFQLSKAALGLPALVVDDSMQRVNVNFSPENVEGLGSHVLVWTAQDEDGNIATATQRLLLVDETPPRLFFPPCIWTADHHLIGELPLLVLCFLSSEDNVDQPENLQIDIAPRSFSRPGTYSLSLSARDLSDNEALITGTFTILDMEPPTIIASSTVYVQGPTPLMLTPEILGSPRALDNADPSPTLTLVDRGLVELSRTGTYTLELKANAFGLPGAAHNTRSELVVVYQVEGEAPVLRAPPDRVYEPRQLPLTGAELLGALLGTTAVTAFDTPDITESLTADSVIDGTGPLRLDFSARELDGLGTATITWTAEDRDGNRVEALQLIRLVDRSAPTLRPAPDQTAEFAVETLPLSLDGALAAGRLHGPVAEDNLDVSPRLSLEPPTVAGLGMATLAWTATDASGNRSAVLLQVVNFVDRSAPTLRPAPDQTAEFAVETLPLSLDGALAAGRLHGPVAEDNLDVSPRLSLEPPTVAGLGMATLAWTATDASGNRSAVLLQVVNFVDRSAPTLRPALDQTAEFAVEKLPLSLDGALADGRLRGPIAEDNIDASSRLSLEPSTVTGLGTATLSWAATDASGNRSAVLLQVVNFVDRSAPTLRPAPDQTAEFTVEKLPLSLDGALADGRLRGPIAEDNIDASPRLSLEPSTVAGLGTATLSWAATDASGNRSAVLLQVVNFIDGSAQPPPPDPGGGSTEDGGLSTGALSLFASVWLALLLFGQGIRRGLGRTAALPAGTSRGVDPG